MAVISVHCHPYSANPIHANTPMIVLPDFPAPRCVKSNANSSFLEVDQVRRLLLLKLPYELVDIIFEEAQFWAYTSAECNLFFSIRASCALDFKASRMILVSEAVPVCTRVKMVQFRIHSQEYPSRWSRKPYDSYTWFEASILRPSDLPPSANYPPDVIELGNRRWIKIFNPHDRRYGHWKVQHNATEATPEPHIVTWEPTYGIGESLSDDDCDSETGRGSGLGFVETLRAGDRIALFGRALYAGRENHVFSTKIEIACQT